MVDANQSHDVQHIVDSLNDQIKFHQIIGDVASSVVSVSFLLKKTNNVVHACIQIVAKRVMIQLTHGEFFFESSHIRCAKGFAVNYRIVKRVLDNYGFAFSENIRKCFVRCICHCV